MPIWQVDYERNIELVYDMLKNGTIEARKKANETLNKVKSAMKINYFETEEFLAEIVDKYSEKW